MVPPCVLRQVNRGANPNRHRHGQGQDGHINSIDQGWQEGDILAIIGPLKKTGTEMGNPLDQDIAYDKEYPRKCGQGCTANQQVQDKG